MIEWVRVEIPDPVNANSKPENELKNNIGFNGEKRLDIPESWKGFVKDSTRSNLSAIQEVNELMWQKWAKSLRFTYWNSFSDGDFRTTDNGLTAFWWIKYTNNEISCVADFSMFTDRFIDEIRTDTIQLGCMKQFIDLESDDSKLQLQVSMWWNLKFSWALWWATLQRKVHESSDLPIHDHLEQLDRELTVWPEFDISLDYLPNGFLRITNSANISVFLDKSSYLNFSTKIEWKVANFKFHVWRQVHYFSKWNNKVENNTSEAFDSSLFYGFETPKIWNTSFWVSHSELTRDDRKRYTIMYLKIDY